MRKMKFLGLTFLVLIVLVSMISAAVPVSEVFGASVLLEFPICTQGSSQYHPAIYGNVVVWQDDRNGNPDIYGYDLSTTTEFPICTQGSSQIVPEIYGNIVVLMDYRNGKPDIYGYDLSTTTEFPICTQGSWQENSAIYGNIVVWTDWRNGRNIYGYDLSTSTEFPICTQESTQNYPAIYGDIVVWRDYRHGNADIYGYDLSTSTEFPIITNTSTQLQADIHGNIVVWLDDRNGNEDVYGYNLSTSTEFPICTQGSSQYSPAIYGNIVVWMGYRNGNPDIYGYDLSTTTEFPICTQGHSQYTPDIYCNVVVWSDGDIHGAMLDTNSCTGPVTSNTQATPNPTNCAPTVTVTATVDDSGTGNTNIQQAEYFVDVIGPNGTGTPMTAQDSTFDSPTENVTATINVSGWAPGLYNIFVHGQDSIGNWGGTQQITLNVIQDCTGPVTSNTSATPDPTNCAPTVTVTATIDDSGTGNANIQQAEYFIDSIGPNGTGTPLSAQDGFDSPTENVVAVIDVTGLSGSHIYVHGQDVLGNWGAVQPVSLTVSCQEAIQKETPPTIINQQIRPLAQYNISTIGDLSIEVETLLSQAKAQDLDTSDVEELIRKAEEFLTKAQEYFRGKNYIAANIYALKALEKYQKAIDLLAELLD